MKPMRTTEGGAGGVVVCLGVGGLIDLESMLGLEVDDEGQGGMGDVEVWVIDARRPWNLSNVFGAQSMGAVNEEGVLVAKVEGVNQGRITPAFRPGKGGIFVFDDGDIEEELGAERDAYVALAEMPDLGEDDGSDSENDEEEEERIPESGQAPKKRKSLSDEETDSDSDAEEGTPRKKRRSNSV